MDVAAAETSFRRNCRDAWAEDHFQLIVMPTEKCNFRCVYCYEDFALGRMERSVVEGIKALVRRRAPSLSSIEISWFGGEPTVASDIVLEVMADAQDACRSNGVKLRGGMTTNGFLLSGARYLEFHRHGVTDFQITLDGPQAYHDTTRLQANRKGSFADIWNNLLEIRDIKADGEILLRIHLTRKNADVIPRFVAEIERTFADDPRFRFSLQPVEALGGDNDISELIIPAAVRDWGHRAGTAPEPNGSSLERAHPDDYVCYAAKANSYVIRSDGRVGKCTVALKSDSNCIGRINPDGSLAIDAAKLGPWLSGWTTQHPGALSCPAAAVFG
ncbi:radical SAM protein [Rhodopseudomonas palustris]|uniref:Radical SAM n=1 Tax=Rhodopseudomonas palustris (strain BisB18) TaxID=316056 RepID=Q212A3_RHOPB